MDESARVHVHESAFPRELRKQLLEGLRALRLDPKFLYLGLKQTIRWLELHEAHSPARQDPSTGKIYEEAFSAIGGNASGAILNLVGLAAGGGQKEARALELLREQGKTVFFTPCDLSLELVLTAHEVVTARLRGLQSNPVLCDLARCSTLPALLKDVDPGGTERVVMFFGTIHNFEPGELLPKLLNAVRAKDTLLVGANLAPEDGYDEALQRILPQYRNPMTAEWMLGFLEDLGVQRNSGELELQLADGEGIAGLKRIEATFRFREECAIRLYREEMKFPAGARLRLFFSYRYTPRHLREVLQNFGLKVLQEWISGSGEEGVFLCRRK